MEDEYEDYEFTELLFRLQETDEILEAFENEITPIIEEEENNNEF